jgi:Cu2+-exporting ATPase
LLRVKPGEKIPVDGKITDGNHYRRIDDFGEPIPLDKKADDTVIAGTINGNKSLYDCRKNWFETFRKLCKWLIQPVAPEHRYKIGDRIAKYYQ